MLAVRETSARNLPLTMAKSADPLNVKLEIDTEAPVTCTRKVLPVTPAVVVLRVFNCSVNDPEMSKPETSVMFGVLSVPFFRVRLSAMPGSLPPAIVALPSAFSVAPRKLKVEFTSIAIVLPLSVSVNTPDNVKPEMVKSPVAITRTPLAMEADEPGIVTLELDVLTSNLNVMSEAAVKPSELDGPADRVTVRRAATPLDQITRFAVTLRLNTRTDAASTSSVASAAMNITACDVPLIVCTPVLKVKSPSSVKPFSNLKLPEAITRTPGVIATEEPGMVTLLEDVLTSNENVI